MKPVYAMTLVLFLSACGTAKTVVMEPVKSGNRFPDLTLQEEAAAVAVPAEVRDQLRAVLEKGLYDSNAFARGSTLTLAYTFVSHDPGNQFARWFWGGLGNAGEGSMTVQVRYLEGGTHEVGRTQVEGRIGSGFFGGSFKEAVTRLGEDVVKFTLENFGTAPTAH